jgi:hypothetical protein
MFGVFRSREMLQIFKRQNYEIEIGAQILKRCKQCKVVKLNGGLKMFKVLESC